MKVLVFLILSMCFVCASAAPSENGNVTLFQTHNAPDSNTENSSRKSKRFFVKLDGNISEGKCDPNEYWFGYLDTESGRAQYSAILAATMAGKPILLEATDSDSCEHSAMLIRNVYNVW